ncbi:MAG TPA: UDP-N-acetylglucosamine 2-epimerase (non-hydrolyzing) [Bacteroidia bacterium]|jgi:UDP-GlcNAc3NAcA epimerase|nr:UDP-N-acetylglucosamine 2-epimerase (non-hydrolyzing) [Bacteroidia bacterium]
MLKIVTVIGARPQIIKAAALSRAIRTRFAKAIREVIVHTGQHYDANMSDVFFTELEIPQADYNLNVGSGTHGKQTAAMITGLEEILLREKPDAIVLYGDTNSTLAGAIAASKIHIPVVHIEAGLRSFSKAMPEEVNRILSDHISTLLFSPTATGYQNLLREGFKADNPGPYGSDNPKIYHCGDVMYDNSLYFSAVAIEKTDILKQNGLRENSFVLATIHRNNNSDEPVRLNALFRSLHRISTEHSIRIVLPLHPRTSRLLETNLDKDLYLGIKENKNFLILPPASFLEMIALEKQARIVITDSGGVQKEAYYFQKPCIILRPETEWVELVECGAAIIADADEARILKAYDELTAKRKLEFPPLFGDGKAAEFICSQLIQHIPLHAAGLHP